MLLGAFGQIPEEKVKSQPCWAQLFGDNLIDFLDLWAMKEPTII
jgi:hypothetical protein